ncbi:MAG: M14 family zinc carboxypeptidase [Ignavibacteriales bacterium]|nr:M14 family zinc carboxypeptidase [Ignavibacteriales bacterium]
MNSNELFSSLFNDYDNYREKKLNSDFISHAQLKELVAGMQNQNLFRVEELGESIDGKEIFSVVFGEGETKILAWSQMHGDEPTATAALFDLFNFFSSKDQYDDLRKALLKKITFHFIPMLNPDGAEMFTRENAYNIDLNRDALRLQSYESKILWDYAGKLEPEFGFNLHDQNSYYTAGRSNKASAISLLAPPMNHVKSTNYIREKSMQVICKINEALSLFIPQNIARYKDDFEPRAFGDNFTKNDISTILIESGYYKNDFKKDFVRKLNFIALLSAFNSIAEKDYENIDHKKYFDIPENEELLFDLLLRNLTLNYNGRNFKIDIGINREKKRNKESQSFYYKSKIADLGDLSIFYGIEEHDLTGYQVIPDNKLSVDEPADLKIFIKGQLKKEVKNGFMNDPVK